MTITSSMESYAARLASFNATPLATKKRASDPKGKRTLRWPHKSPPPPPLARAGFFYRPTSSSPDNTTCYLCDCNLDGWEEDDDAVVEHLKHAPECGWAITVAIEQDVENGSYSLEDPMSERIMNARRMTFGSNWPHENKKGWMCKTKKMVEAGWHYCPTLESEDFVKCSYCQLSLDGWERKDKPLDEHQRRSPDCTFFTLYASIKPHPERSNKSRASKISRMSTQSDFTAASDGLSIAETDVNPDQTTLSTAESSKPFRAARGGKKTARVKRTASKAERKASKASDYEQQGASSFLEPEDDDFEVKVVPSPEITLSSRKRKSGETSVTETSHDPLQNEENENNVQPPPAKRRNTRARASIVQAQKTSISARFSEDALDTHMSDVEEMHPPSAPASKKKKGKSNKNRTTSTTREASTASTASKASLRAAVPNDEELDAALRADLDRPLTDDEAVAEPVEFEQPKGRRLTRSKPGSKKATASIAPARRGMRARSVTVDEPPNTDLYPTLEPAADNTDESMGSCDIVQPSTRAKIPDCKQEVYEDPIPCSVEPPEESIAVSNQMQAQEVVPILKSQQPKSKQGPRQQPTRNTRASNVPSSHDTVALATGLKCSLLGHRTLQDDSGHETDADGLNQSRTKRPSKKASGAKKVRRGKKASIAIQIVPDVVQAPPNVILLDETNHAPTVDTERADVVELDGTRTVQLQEEDKPAQATELSNAQGRAGNNKAVAQTAPVASSPEHSAEHSLTSLPPPSVHMTPRPAFSPQSSDAENQPPSSRPSSIRPPLSMQSPPKVQMTRIPLAAKTPASSPSRGKFSKLQSTLPWTAIDLGRIFNGTPGAEKENDPFVTGKATESAQDELTSPEKKLTVEQWIQFNAQRGEEKLRDECERLVGKFESEGVRALRSLEGIICTQ